MVFDILDKQNLNLSGTIPRGQIFAKDQCWVFKGRFQLWSKELKLIILTNYFELPAIIWDSNLIYE